MPDPQLPDFGKEEQRLIVAFVQGAKWWEWNQSGCTMWQEDQRIAHAEAERRAARGRLGETSEEWAERLMKQRKAEKGADQP